MHIEVYTYLSPHPFHYFIGNYLEVAVWGVHVCFVCLRDHCREIHIKQGIGDCVSLAEIQLNFRANTATKSAARVCIAQLQAASFTKQLYFF